MKNEMFNTHERRPLEIFDKYHTYGKKFRELCERGVSVRTLTKDSKCRYQTKNSYYRILMPFKEEDLNKDPLIQIYHDVLYDDEIVKIKSMSMASMIDATIVEDHTGLDVAKEDYRLGQFCWLYDGLVTNNLDSLNARIESFTEFSTQTAEPYQTVNYGLGGHYIQHVDAFPKHMSDKNVGNRLATVLFYMSNVNHGGHTVFPMLDIVSSAEKGAALFWYNLHWSNGSIHDESHHGSCPILKGNKWIVTRWLHEEGQNLPYNWRN